MKFALLVLVIFYFSVMEGKSPTTFFCGRKLSDSLALLCPSDEAKKRSSESLNSVYSTDEALSLLKKLGVFEDGPYPKDGGSDEHFEVTRSLTGFRAKRGIISECCDQPCTVDELLTYC